MKKLNREEKAQVVAGIVERLASTSTVVAADFRGLSVAQVAELRAKLREADAEMTVVKNTLTRRAVDESGHTALLPYLTGPTGLVWVAGDPAAAAKVLSDFAKQHEDVFSVRGGMLDGADLDTASLKTLASLPTKDVLLAQLAGGIAAPLTGLAGGLQALVSTMARTLAAVAASGQLAAGEVASAPSEAPSTDDAAASEQAPAEAEGPADDAPAAEETADEAAPADDGQADQADSSGDAGDGEPETPES